MKSMMLFAILSLLSGCVAVPAEPPPQQLRRGGTADLPSGELLFCTLPSPDANCRPKSTGLVARGLGGLFLPLDVEVSSLKLENARAEVALVVNDISAHCSAGTSNIYTSPPTINVTGIYCNWLGIGNVVASLQLLVDSSMDGDLYRGRYRIRFLGTGNGGGAGYFLARKLS